MLAMVCGWIGLFIMGDINNDPSLEKGNIWFILFVIIAVSIVRMTFVVGTLYRCPICDKFPMSGEFWLGPASLSYNGKGESR